MVVALAPDLLFAFFCLLVLVALEPIWFPMLENSLAALPGPLQAIASGWLNAIKAQLDYLYHWLVGALAPAVTLIWGAWYFADARVSGVPSALSAAWQALWRLQFNVIPHAISGLQGWTQGQLSALWDSTVGLVENAQAYAQQLVSAESAARTAAEAALWDSTVGLVENAQAYAQQLVSGAEADARTLFQQALSIDQQNFDSLANLLNISAQTLQQDLSQAFQQAEADIAAGVAGAEQQAQAGLGSLENLLQGQIGAVAAGAAAATGVVAQAVQAIEDSPCQQFCDPLGVLGQALQLLDLGAIFGLLAYCASDPAGAVDFLDSNFAQPMSALLGDAEAIIGLGQRG